MQEKVPDYRPIADGVNMRCDDHRPCATVPATMTTDVTLSRDGAVATVTLNRPERRNALSDALLSALGAA